MESTIYIKLLGEGSLSFRPVPATLIIDNIYKLGGSEIYDPDDENWEFPPGSVVRVQLRESENGEFLIAISQL